MVDTENITMINVSIDIFSTILENQSFVVPSVPKCGCARSRLLYRVCQVWMCQSVPSVNVPKCGCTKTKCGKCGCCAGKIQYIEVAHNVPHLRRQAVEVSQK